MNLGRPITRAGITSEFRQVDIRQLQREGLLMPGRLFTLRCEAERGPLYLQGAVDDDSVAFSYSVAKENGSSAAVHRTYRVRVVRTPCRYGGCRTWFLCPREDCSREVAILYADATLACRSCHRLTYLTQRLDVRQRELLRAQALRRKLGGPTDFWEPVPPRPKRMREWTYTKIGLKIIVSERHAVAFALSMAKSRRNDFSSLQG